MGRSPQRCRWQPPETKKHFADEDSGGRQAVAAIPPTAVPSCSTRASADQRDSLRVFASSDLARSRASAADRSRASAATPANQGPIARPTAARGQWAATLFANRGSRKRSASGQSRNNWQGQDASDWWPRGSGGGAGNRGEAAGTRGKGAARRERSRDWQRDWQRGRGGGHKGKGGGYHSQAASGSNQPAFSAPGPATWQARPRASADELDPGHRDDDQPDAEDEDCVVNMDACG